MYPTWKKTFDGIGKTRTLAHGTHNRFHYAKPVTVASIARYSARRVTLFFALFLARFVALLITASAFDGVAHAQSRTTPAITHPANTTAASSAHAQATPRASTLLVLGDSLSAEYGLPRGTGWVALLSQRLNQTADHYIVTNGSISGDTTSDGLSRLPNLLKRTNAKIVIVELGGNDALRGLPLATTRTNLTAIIGLAKAAGTKVLLIGMQIPPNYGPTYTRAFASMYGELAKQNGIGLVPFLLEGIADKPELFQADQIHPVPQAQPDLLNNVWTPLQTLIHAK
jgi:acyl-CoA thioesterase-1